MNVTRIVWVYENPILYTEVYEVRQIDCHKALVSENYIAENLFSQVD